jgi:hypothetical protein
MIRATSWKLLLSVAARGHFRCNCCYPERSLDDRKGDDLRPRMLDRAGPMRYPRVSVPRNPMIGGERMKRNLRRLLIGAAVTAGILAATAAPAAAGLASTNHTEPGR